MGVNILEQLQQILKNINEIELSQEERELFQSHLKNDNFTKEAMVGEMIEDIFDVKFINNKCFMNTRYRPDFQNSELKIIFEFDGYLHYNNTKTIYNDRIKDKLYVDNGYKLYRIPYFVQMNDSYLKHILGVQNSQKINLIFPNGFINKQCLLPCDFNILGLKRFVEDIKLFEYCANEIYKSLKWKCEILGSPLVLPNADI